MKECAVCRKVSSDYQEFTTEAGNTLIICGCCLNRIMSAGLVIKPAGTKCKKEDCQCRS